MVRFTHVVLAYFVIGAVMWGGGALDYTEVGVVQEVITDPSDGTTSDALASKLEQTTGAKDTLATLATGGITFIVGLVVELASYLFWPITTMLVVNAPPRVVVLLGGAPTLAFYLGFVTIIRRSA